MKNRPGWASVCFLVGLAALPFLVWNFGVAAPPETPQPANSQRSAAQYRQALPGYKYAFPRDHGSHPEFQTEWWYYTGHLKSTSGENFSYQLTFFRSALTPENVARPSKWATRQMIFAHLALTDQNRKKFYFSERISRDALGLAHAETVDKASAPTPRIWIDDWHLQYLGATGNRQQLQARGFTQDKSTFFGLNLTQTALKPLVIQGEDGVSPKAQGQGRASHYYSFTRLETEGELQIDDQKYSVSGQSWFDHEFGSNVLSAQQLGWDWFSLQFDDGTELMLFQLRLRDGGIDPYSAGTFVAKDGSSRHLKREEFTIEPLQEWYSPHTKTRYPSSWRIEVPSAQLKLTLQPTLADQEIETPGSSNVTYWEGSVQIGGNRTGKGYVEMTGYAEEFDGKF